MTVFLPQVNSPLCRKFLRSPFHFLLSCLCITHTSHEGQEVPNLSSTTSIFFLHICIIHLTLWLSHTPQSSQWSFQSSELCRSLTTCGAFPWAIFFALFFLRSYFWQGLPTDLHDDKAYVNLSPTPASLSIASQYLISFLYCRCPLTLWSLYYLQWCPDFHPESLEQIEKQISECVVQVLCLLFNISQDVTHSRCCPGPLWNSSVCQAFGQVTTCTSEDGHHLAELHLPSFCLPDCEQAGVTQLSLGKKVKSSWMLGPSLCQRAKLSSPDYVLPP